MDAGFLKGKFAGIPVWVWGVIIIGALLIAVFRRSNGGALDTASAKQQDPVILSYQSTQIPRPTSLATTYNAEWARKAYTYLSAQGYPEYDTRNALSAYLEGRPINGTDSSYVAMAKTYVGNPPQPLGTPVTPPTTWSSW